MLTLNYFCAEVNYLTLFRLYIVLILNYTVCKMSWKTSNRSSYFLCLQKINFTTYMAVHFCINVSRILLWREILPTARCYKEKLNFFQTEVLIILCPEKWRLNKVWWLCLSVASCHLPAHSGTYRRLQPLVSIYSPHPHDSGKIQPHKTPAALDCSQLVAYQYWMRDCYVASYITGTRRV